MNSYSTSWWSLLPINRPREDERLSWPFSENTTLLRDLNRFLWVQKWIWFRLCVLTYRCLHFCLHSAPSYDHEVAAVSVGSAQQRWPSTAVYTPIETLANCTFPATDGICLAAYFQDAPSLVTYTRFSLPELTARVNGPSWRVTGFHYLSTRAVNSGRQLG